MPRKKGTAPPKPTIPPGVRRVAGFLTCNTCRLFIPYQGYDGQPEEDRPKHRCVRDIQPFSKFTIDPPKTRTFP